MPYNREYVRSLVRTSILLAGTIVVTRDAEATNYPLRCNSAAGLIMKGDPPGLDLTIGAAHAAQGYDTAPVQPGTCAWHDRGMRPTESYCVAYHHGMPPFFSMKHGPDNTQQNDLECIGIPQSSIECGLVTALHAQVTFVIGSTDSNGCFVPVSWY